MRKVGTMPNSFNDQAMPANDKQAVRESLITLFTEAGYDVRIDQSGETPNETEHHPPVHRTVLTQRGTATGPAHGSIVERFPIRLRSAKPLKAQGNPNRVTYQGMTYTICRHCYRLIGSGRVEASLRAAERFHHCPEMDATTEAENDRQT